MILRTINFHDQSQSSTLSLTCNVTIFCDLLETVLDKERAYKAVLSWLLGPQLPVMGHIQGFVEARERKKKFDAEVTSGQQNIGGRSWKKV